MCVFVCSVRCNNVSTSQTKQNTDSLQSNQPGTFQKGNHTTSNYKGKWGDLIKTVMRCDITGHIEIMISAELPTWEFQIVSILDWLYYHHKIDFV